MKADEITYGHHDFGMFHVSIQPCVFDSRSADDVGYFEVFVTEPRDGVHYYVDVAERFGWFDHFGKFTRQLTQDDLVEYNSQFNNLFHKIQMPTWKLGRHSVVYLERLCLDATKKAKRGK